MYLFARNHNNDLVWLNLSYFVIKVESFAYIRAQEENKLTVIETNN